MRKSCLLLLLTGSMVLVTACNKVTENVPVNPEELKDLVFADAQFFYDGTAHSIYINGDIPEGIEVSYSNNGKTDVGTYEVTALLSDTTGTYTDSLELTATMTIAKATFDASTISFTNKEVTYDGEAHSIEIEGNLPTGITVEYENNEQVDVGVYVIQANFSVNGNFNPVDSLTATLQINKADYDMSNVAFLDKSEIYDGTEKSIEISGNLPEGLQVSYTNNGQINAGTYEVTASFEGDENHNPVESMQATLTIEKATIVLAGVSFSD